MMTHHSEILLALSRATKSATVDVRPSIPSLDEWFLLHLAEKMRKETGKKRVRRKKAKRSLRISWLILKAGQPIMRRVNYCLIGRQLIHVEPLPHPPWNSLLYS